MNIRQWKINRRKQVNHNLRHTEGNSVLHEEYDGEMMKIISEQTNILVHYWARQDTYAHLAWTQNQINGTHCCTPLARKDPKSRWTVQYMLMHIHRQEGSSIRSTFIFLVYSKPSFTPDSSFDYTSTQLKRIFKTASCHEGAFIQAKIHVNECNPSILSEFTYPKLKTKFLRDITKWCQWTDQCKKNIQ